MSAGKHFILAVVDGPSEARPTSIYQERPCDGAVMCILAYICTAYGDSIGEYVCVQNWRTPIPASFLRSGGQLFGYAQKVNRWIRLARVTGQYSMILFLVDNDHFADTPSRQQQLSIGICEAMKDEELPHRPIIVDGVAVEMIESWLLADTSLLAPSHGLPPGKQAEDLWGDEKDQSSHHPKCLLSQKVCKPRNWRHAQCIQHWNVGNAIKNATSLRIFVEKLQNAADELGLR